MTASCIPPQLPLSDPTPRALTERFVRIAEGRITAQDAVRCWASWQAGGARSDWLDAMEVGIDTAIEEGGQGPEEGTAAKEAIEITGAGGGSVLIGCASGLCFWAGEIRMMPGRMTFLTTQERSDAVMESLHERPTISLARHRFMIIGVTVTDASTDDWIGRTSDGSAADVSVDLRWTHPAKLPPVDLPPSRSTRRRSP